VYQWEDFCQKVQYERRFFKTKELLDKLFGKPTEYEGGPINPVYVLNAGPKIFRARIFDDSFTQEILGRNPEAQLGAPPRDRAQAGRMNVEYIPAFYGAFSEDTAVAEIRPGIGEEVAIGEFVLQRDVKVFDFTVFSRAPHEAMSMRTHALISSGRWKTRSAGACCPTRSSGSKYRRRSSRNT